MKKKTLLILAVLITALACLFTSCSASVEPPKAEDEFGYVTFGNGGSRSLTTEYGIKSYDELYWYYTAVKQDGFGLTGQSPKDDTNKFIPQPVNATKNDKGIVTKVNKGLSGEVGPFSQGAWVFTLYAYESLNTDNTGSNLVYQGTSTTIVLKGGETKAVPVSVSLQGETGKIDLSRAYFQWANNSTANGQIYVTVKLNDNDPTILGPLSKTNASGYQFGSRYLTVGNSDDIAANYYTCTINAYLASDVDSSNENTGATINTGANPVATQVMGLRVYGNATTYITGNLVESPNSYVDFTVPQQSMVAFNLNQASVPSNPAGTKDDENKPLPTTIDFGTNLSTTATHILTLEVADIDTSSAKFTVENTKSAVASLSFDLKAIGTNASGATTQTPVDDFKSYVTVTTYIAKNLSQVQVKYNGIGNAPIATDETSGDRSIAANITTDSDTALGYNPSTGLLRFKTDHFSEYYVVADEVVALNVNTNTAYATLKAAISSVGSGETIKLMKDTSGDGIAVASGSNFTVDFNTHTYNIDGTTVGSTGTETNGFQLLRGSNIEFKNGTITSNKAKILIQNYCNLTLRDVTLDGSNIVGRYTLSNNYGNTTVTGNTRIIAKEGNCAFDVYYWPKNGYGDGLTVTFDEHFTGEVIGNIEYGSDGTENGKANIAEKARLVIKSGSFEGSISTYNLPNNGATGISIEGGSFSDLASAIKYATDGATIKLAADVTGKGIGSADGDKVRESLTIDFNGYTYTMNDPAVGSSGTETQAMHWGTSLGAVTLRNGTFKVAEGATGVKMALQNYINFTAENMTFNFSKIPVTNYGTTGKFDPNTGEFKEYSGLEVPMFNNNSGKMVLKKSTIIMPNDSTKGIYTDGNGVEIIDCIINGAVVIESANKIVKVKNSDITKGVSPYFNSGYTVKESVEGGYTVYTNQTVVNISTTEELNRAITNATDKKANISIDSGKTITLDSGIANEGDNSRTITFIGDGSQTVDVITNTVNAEGGQLSYQRGSSFTFENLTIQAGEGNFDGIVCDELTFKNCTIKGKLTLYGKATFTNCVFDNTMANQYSIWTWGGTDVTFEGCTFNTNGKAILLYGQATEANPTNLVVNNCTFNDRNNGTVGKAAIEIGNDYNATYTLTVKNANVNGFAVGKNTNSKVWANKNSMDAEHLSVTINGTRVH